MVSKIDCFFPAPRLGPPMVDTRRVDGISSSSLRLRYVAMVKNLIYRVIQSLVRGWGSKRAPQSYSNHVERATKVVLIADCIIRVALIDIPSFILFNYLRPSQLRRNIHLPSKAPPKKMLLLKSTQNFARKAFQRSLQTRGSSLSTMRPAVDPMTTISFVYGAFMGTVLCYVVNESTTVATRKPE